MGCTGSTRAAPTPIPALASSCTPNAAATVWTCNLRTGVRFHDGATLDADDVVTSFAAQWDADHPLHAGHDGTFAQFAASFGGFLQRAGGDRPEPALVR